MSSSLWLRSLSHRLLGRPARRPRPTRQRLCLESLEDRIVPTIVFEPAFGTESTNFGSGQKLNATPVELIFWGSTYWNNPPSGAATASQVANAYSTLLGSPYYNHLGQYGAGGATNYLAGWWIDNVDSDPGSTVTDSQIRQEIVNAINDPNSPINPPSNYNSTPLYVVVTPQGTAIDSSSVPMKGKVGFEAAVKDGNKSTPAGSDPKQSKDGPGGGVGGVASTTVGYHYNFGANTNYGNYNLIYAWIDNLNLSGLKGTINNLDSMSSIFSHESSEAMTDAQPSSGITVNAGSSLPGGGSNGEIGDFEPEDFNLDLYRVDGVLAQATWDYVHQAFVVSDGNSQAFDLFSQYGYDSRGKLTFLGNKLVVNGDQLGAGYNDDITLFTTSVGGVGVIENGESVRFEPGLDITEIDINPGGGSNSVDVISTPSGTSTNIDDVGNDTVAIGNYVSSVNNGAGFMDGIQGMVDVFGSGATTLYVDDSGDSVGQGVTMYDGQINYGGAAPVYYTPTNILTGGVNYLAVYGGYGNNIFSVENTSYLYGDTYLSTGLGNDTVYVYGTQGGLFDYNPGGSDSTSVGGGYTINLYGFVKAYGAGSTSLYINDSSDGAAQTVTMNDGSVFGLGFSGIYWTPTSSSTGGVTYVVVEGGHGDNTFNVENTSSLKFDTFLYTGTGNDTVNVYATQGELYDYNPGGDDTTNIGLGNMGSINGFVDVYAPGSTSLWLNDSNDTTARTVTMNDGSITGLGGGAGTISWAPSSSSTGGVTSLYVYGSGAGSTYDINNTSYLYDSTFLLTGEGNDTVNVYAAKGSATTGGLYVFNQGGDDSVDVGLGSVATINGLVYAFGNGATALLVDDHLDSTSRTVTLAGGQLTGLGNTGTLSYGGGVTTATIDGPSKASTYDIQSTPAGTAVTFNGGVGSDTFNLGSGNSLGGIQGAVTINGGGGTNTVNANDSSSASGQSYTLSATQLAGSDFVPITYAYASLHALNVTGSGNDTLTLLTPAPVVATTFNGSGGTNTLVGPNTSTSWNISGANSGKVDNIAFSNFQNLAGGTGNDSFDFTTSTASLSGTLNGGGGTNNTNTLSYATLGSSYLVNVTLSSNTAGAATAVGGGFGNINYLLGSTDASNTLTGPNGTNYWVITGNNAGYLNTGPTRVFSFTGTPQLVGGTGVDDFRFNSTSGNVVGINGGGAPLGQGDWLNYSLFPSSSTVTVNLATGSASNVNGGAAGAVTNIQNVVGSTSGTNNLTGDAQGNILIGGSGLNTLTGGSGSSLLIGGSGQGSITGGSGSDILIAGATTNNASTAAGEDSLMAILAELQSADTFAQKVYDLIHGTDSGDPNGQGSDLNGSNKLTWGGTVRASTGAFTLSGDTSVETTADWFFSNASSTLSDFNDDGVQDEHNNNALGVF